MEQTYNFRPATGTDTGRIWEIIGQAKAQMYREHKQQWNETYPAIEHIRADIREGHAYVLCDGGNVIAYGAVLFGEEPAYRTILGKWLGDKPYVTLHRLAVADEMKGRGIAVTFMQETEKLGLQKGIGSFRADTNSDNIYMQKVLKKCGFAYCGEIEFQGGSRMAYEKLL